MSEHTPRVTLRREGPGQYTTPDGRYRIEFEDWWLENECECIMCQQGSACPNGRMAKREGWTVYDTISGDHLCGEPFAFETMGNARKYLAHHLLRVADEDRR